MKIKIDGNALRKAIEHSGNTLSSASKKLGYSPSYLYYVISQGEMEERVAMSFKTVLGIDVNQVAPKESYDFTPEEWRLYKVINKACYDAFSGALKKWGGLYD